jgi:hypothetical protein
MTNLPPWMLPHAHRNSTRTPAQVRHQLALRISDLSQQSASDARAFRQIRQVQQFNNVSARSSHSQS